MKMDYRRDLQHNYLVVETGEKTENYITRMMTENQVQGLLGCECRRMDQKKLYYYDITSKISLAEKSRLKKVKGSEVLLIIQGLLQVLVQLEEYLIPADQICLDWNYIYLDPVSCYPSFCCLPAAEKKLEQGIRELLEKAFHRFVPDQAYETFVEKNKKWLEDYSLYMAIKNSLGGIAWSEWEAPLKTRQEAALEEKRVELKEQMDFICFQQYEFAKQWEKLKQYANEKGIQIIGDIPIYVAFDSADAWANPELFQFDENSTPLAVAGCPPDAFAATGQLWGNPLYRWDYHAQTGYVWWISRLRHCFTLYDVVRVDHFRGFDEYYAIPYGDKTAENGVWKKGPGIDLFHTVKKELGDVNIIAEDLGYLTESVMKLVEDTGYPGMKVLQFAFDSREESNYLPHNYPHNCVVYTGTHDNNTVRGWLDDMCEEDNALAEDYMNNADTPKDERPWEFIRLALGSVADLAVIPLQDYLCLGTEARINLPSTLGNNWKWRLVPGQVTDEMLEKMCHLNKLFGRL